MHVAVLIKQFLIICLLMDPLASLALATEQPDQKLLDQKPYARDMPLISGIMIKNILTQTFWQLGIMLSMLWMPVLSNVTDMPTSAA